MFWNFLAAAFVAACISFPAQADSAAIRLFPMASLFVPDGDAGKWVAKEFTQAVSPAVAGKYFAETFRQSFPESVGEVNDANKRRTFVVSLQVPRASLYRVQKVDGTATVYLPVTGSIYFTNLVSGEVLFTMTRTHYEVATLAGQADRIPAEKLSELFRNAYKALVDDLVIKARKQFSPTTVSASVKSFWNGLYVLDRGEDSGIAIGDSLADAEMNSLRIVSTDAEYSIAVPELGKVAVGVAFAKQTNQTLDDLKRPRVMILVDKVPEGLSPEIIRQMFADELADKAPVSVVHVNPMFANILKTGFSKSYVSSDDSSKRKLPDFFVLVSVPEATDFDLPTNLGYQTNRTYLTLATAELLDRTGRVLFAAQGRDRIDDEVTSGMTFDNASRRDVSVKNALIDLAKQFNELKFRKLDMPISLQGESASIKDELGVLSQGQPAVAYRSIGKVEGIAGNVLMPVRQLEVSAVSNGVANFRSGLGFTAPAMEIQSGDIVRVNTSQQAPTITRKRFVSCGTVDNLGTVVLGSVGDLTLNIFASGANAPFFIKDFGTQLNGQLDQGSRFEKALTLASSSYDYCIEPAYKIEAVERLCEGEPLSCAKSATVRFTLRVKKGKGQEVVAKTGLATKMTSARFFATASPQAEEASFRVDLLDVISKQAPIIVEKLSNTQFD